MHGRYNATAWAYLVEQGYAPEIQEGDRELLASAHPDFLAFNYYNSQTVGAAHEGEALSDGGGDQQISVGEAGVYRSVSNPDLPTTTFGWGIDPVGFRTVLRRVWDRYQLPLIITENGLGEFDEPGEDGRVHDAYRIDYLRQHIAQLQVALADGVRVFGYCPWSAIDVVSTHQGVAKRYGFIYVDRTDEDLRSLERYRKDSFAWYQRVIATNGAELGAEAASDPHATDLQ